ncbi:hypothetical protein DS884_03695 [Tenacibaculum sp. E3R01]|uniref:hypothetical protein n=1 Tax=Tenacibaculum sp. E3R01 TaxID=2267227 RepID=UPI000DE8A736|nr:hypothetical protein [Tenacibaculum sp. E3R01]RBW61423.1 hypothetical protein DS884_03695 [Tenacibaculum sp. E3R01]
MRTYPRNTKELEIKHSFSFPVDKTKLELIQNNVILRNDIAYVFLKSRILNSLKMHNLFENELFSESFLDKKFNQTDRLKIYNAIKNQLLIPVSKRNKLSLSSLFQLNDRPKIDTRVLTIKDLIFDLIKQYRLTIKGEFETFFKYELDKFK